MQQIVCRFARKEAVKYISHLDLMRALERGMRRAQLPLVYSEGFNPRPRVSYASALSVGYTSDSELVSFALARPMDPAEVRKALNAHLPDGLEILQAWATPPHKTKSSLGETDTAEYNVRVEGPLQELDLPERVAAFLAADEVWIRRVRDKSAKDLDLRPLVSSIEVVHSSATEAELKLSVRTGSSGGAKPEEALGALGVQGRDFHLLVHRSALYVSGSSGRVTRQRLRRLLDHD